MENGRLTKSDYMRLPKKRLAEMLEERDNLEENIEDIIARKLSELYRPQWPMSPIEPNTPNPFQPISVLYGCPSDLEPIVYSEGETTAASKIIEQ